MSLACSHLNPLRVQTPLLLSALTEVSGGNCSPGTLDSEFTPRSLRWSVDTPRAKALSRVPASTHRRRISVPTVIKPLYPTCSPFHTRPRRLSRSQQGRLWGGARSMEADHSPQTCLQPHLPFLPPAHLILFFILQCPAGSPPPPERPLLAEGTSLFLGFTQ